VFGKEAVDAARMMIDIINTELGGIKSMGGAKLVLVGPEDAGEKPDVTALAAERLIATHRPHIIVGAYISALTAAAAEVTEREKIPFVIDALVDWLTEKGWKYVFRLAPRASDHGRLTVRFVDEMLKAKNITITRVLILHNDGIFGTYVGQGAYLELVTRGYKTVESIAYPIAITDFSPIISRIKEYRPDIIISVPYFHDGVLFAKAYVAAGLDEFVLFVAGAGGCGYADPDSIREIGPAAEYFTNTYSYNPAKDTPWNRKLVEEFKKRYGKLPTEAAGIIFYNLLFIYEVLEEMGRRYPDPLNPALFADRFREVALDLDLKEPDSITAQVYPSGRVKLAPNGQNMYPGVAVIQVIGGEPRVIWPQPEPGVTPVFPRPRPKG
jgi:branched-chain amino acid transport system substrate-binding protein